MFSLASDALDYLRRTDREKIDLIVLDINMPRMDGFEFLELATEEFGEDMGNSIVVMMTTSLAPSDIERAKSFSVVADILNKPLTVEMMQNWQDTLLSS
jgi:CheY-like chemotaxis protein